jgi:hypothetical protein
MAKLRKGAGLPVLLPHGAKNTTCVFLRPPLTYLRLFFRSVRCPQVEHVPSPYIVCFSHIGVGIGEGGRGDLYSSSFQVYEETEAPMEA